MKIIVLGGGMVGSVMAADLATDHEVSCADLTPRHIPNVAYMPLDVTQREAVIKTVAPFDLVIGAVPGHLGYETLKAVIEAGKNVVDISFFPEDALELHEMAVRRNVIAVTDCGVAPGMCNMIAGYFDKQMAIDSYTCLVGGLPVVRTKPYEYKAPFSPIDVIEEYTRPARFRENGNIVTREALSEIEEIWFDGVGTLEAFNTDGLRSLLHTLKHIPNLKEKTLRYPGHAGLMKVFRDTGLFSKEPVPAAGSNVAPVDIVSQLLFSTWKYQRGEEDFTVMQVIIEGQDANGNVKHTWSLYDRYDTEQHVMSMARTTGYTATAVARLLLQQGWNTPGIIPPEHIGSNADAFQFVLQQLKERNVIYRNITFR
ncbi:MAG TPA: saccharopine dehydrogenase C-terminal domain-containing protein [Flavisolibacter sp.]